MPIKIMWCSDLTDPRGTSEVIGEISVVKIKEPDEADGIARNLCADLEGLVRGLLVCGTGMSSLWFE